jgi:hypothetical protein
VKLNLQGLIIPKETTKLLATFENIRVNMAMPDRIINYLILRWKAKAIPLQKVKCRWKAKAIPLQKVKCRWKAKAIPQQKVKCRWKAKAIPLQKVKCSGMALAFHIYFQTIVVILILVFLSLLTNSSKAEAPLEGFKIKYNTAVEKIKTGKTYADRAKDKLSETQIGDLFKKEIPNGKVPLNIQDKELKQQIYTAQRELGEAIKELGDILNLYPGYTDTYIRLVEANLAIGDEAKAMEYYKKCLNLGFEGVTIPYDELRPIFYEIARIDIESGADDAGKTVIDKLIGLENRRLDNEYEKLKRELDRIQRDGLRSLIEQKRQEMIGIEIQRMLVNLELVRFYIDTGRKEAISEYENKKNEYDSKLVLFNKEDASPLTDLYAQIDAALKNINSSFEFSVDQKFLKDVSIILIPEGDNVDKGKFFKLILVPGEESINFLTYITNHGVRIIPSGDYSARIQIPEIEVQNNYLPFRMELKRDIYVEDPMTTSSLRDTTKMWLEKSSDQQPIEIDFSQNIFSNTTTMEIDSKYKTISNDLYKTNIEMSFSVKPSQKAYLKIITQEQPLQAQKEIISYHRNYYIITSLTILFFAMAIH